MVKVAAGDPTVISDWNVIAVNALLGDPGKKPQESFLYLGFVDAAVYDAVVGIEGAPPLDDAGNGYAGLQQIIRIAPDILKLDRSLVDGLHEDPHRLALLEALISFASTTRAAVCAEGVETLEDLAVLAAMDVTYAQGWALARPDAPWAALAPQAAAAASAGSAATAAR